MQARQQVPLLLFQRSAKRPAWWRDPTFPCGRPATRGRPRCQSALHSRDVQSCRRGAGFGGPTPPASESSTPAPSSWLPTRLPAEPHSSPSVCRRRVSHPPSDGIKRSHRDADSLWEQPVNHLGRSRTVITRSVPGLWNEYNAARIKMGTRVRPLMQTERPWHCARPGSCGWPRPARAPWQPHSHAGS